jgi:hypothetical protein
VKLINLSRASSLLSYPSSNKKLLLLLGLLVLIAGGSSHSSNASTETTSLYFPETGFNIEGIFLKYWQEHGGIAQQGYPISNEIQEKSELDGKTYTTQYFERAVFEHHPENRPPFDVLLARLGAMRYQNLYAQAATPPQTPNTSAGSVFFPETGKRLGGLFLDYWKNNGSLMQQGYPLTEEFIEISQHDGKPYRVQYFERAVFEYHPENKAQHQVLLSHLGRFRYDKLHGAEGAGEAAAQPSTTPAADTNLLVTRKVIGSPAVGGHYLFWVEDRDSKRSIYGYDIRSNQEFLVKNLPLGADFLNSDGQTLIWVEGSEGLGDSIHTFSIASKQEAIAIPATSIAEYSGVAVDGDILYYQAGVGLVGHNLSTGQEQLISNKGAAYPVATDGKVLWVEINQQCSPGGPCPFEWNLYLLDRTRSSSGILLATSLGENGFSSYNISGNRVIWADISAPTAASIYDISNGATKNIQSKAVLNPILGGDIAAWSEGPVGMPGGPSNWSIRAYDVNADVSWTVVGESSAVKRAWGIVQVPQSLLAYTSGESLYLTTLHPGGAR